MNFSKANLGWKSVFTRLSVIFCGAALMACAPAAQAQTATDPGVRGGPAGAGGFVTGLNSAQQAVETPSLNFFEEINNVAGNNSVKHVGLGPRFDSNSCNSCHAQPNPGGSSLAANPLFSIFQLDGAVNSMPFFETTAGPTLVGRFPYKSDLVTPDGTVHQLFTITGRTDAGTCSIKQPDFTTAAAENNLIFRNTTQTFGDGFIEIIKDSDIIANMNANQALKASLGISGHPNYNGDDGSINRLGWKAMERSLVSFTAGAYQIENGVSNEFFPNETDETPGCTPPYPMGPPNGQGTHGVPDDRADFATLPAEGFLFPGDPERFGIFQRFLAGPTPGACPTGGNCTNGQTQFNNVGCVLCHTQSFTTPPAAVAALGNVTINLYSDLLVHHMGPGNADCIVQGGAGGDEFRTSPLWGVGQRVFFMSDGRTSDIVQAVEDHFSLSGVAACGQFFGDSEANAVITNFNNLSPTNQQDLIDFLRSL